ncbi:cytidine deaminase [Anaeramoeba flamelloides]|uniref:cytidine deaminase n=1 Tax=Anaeramoeba flamelloides TaxID=1746091 RepID=A0ABQ8XXW6_9EUKA|nr:cytidine deaminase [Anaeramoeba flamelloides]
MTETNLPLIKSESLIKQITIIGENTLLKGSGDKPVKVETIILPESRNKLGKKLYEDLCVLMNGSMNENLQKCLGKVPCEKNDSTIFVNEYLSTTLEDLIEQKTKQNKSFSATEICEIILSIANGLDFVHNKGFCHGYLCSKYIKYCDKTNKFKITNFQNAHKYKGTENEIEKEEKKETKETKENEKEKEQKPVSSFQITRYSQPEIIPRPKKEIASPGASADVYSLGVILYEITELEMYLGTLPDLSAAILVADKGYRPTISKTNEFKAILEKMWDQNPERRPSLKQIKEDIIGLQEAINKKYKTEQKVNKKRPEYYDKEVIYSLEQYSDPKEKIFEEITTEQLMELLDTSSDSVVNSYSPYSKFKVGAALLGTNDEIYCGANIENVSYGLTICAERSAFFHAASKGCREFKALVITSSGVEDFTYPCGACRQVIVEWGQFPVILYRLQDKAIKVTTGFGLLPEAFTPFILENSIN